MSQQGSSIVSGESAEVKYKKALMQIQKIHNANKVLKNQCEEMKSEFQRQIHDLSQSYDHVSKQCEMVKKDKVELQKFLEELQVSNTQLRKEYNNLEREVSYLNDALTEQNNELKKVNAFKDQKGLSALLTSYEDRELNFRKDLARQDELIKNLKVSCETLENQLAEERRQRFKLQDLNGNLKMEISRYRELNANLLHKNQSIVASLLNRTNESKEKYREAQNVLGELGRQLEMVKAARMDQHSTNRSTVSLDSYQAVLQQKSKLQSEILRLRERTSESDGRARELLEMEQKMKRASVRADQLEQQCNMLKSKLIIIETKELMEGVSEEGTLQEFEQQVLANIAHNDPLPAIKNSANSAHFQLMKTYLNDLSIKLTKTIAEKKDLEKRYRSLKEKFSQRAEKAIGWEEQNKLLRGKVEGFERLTERLQFQLQSILEGHEEEMNKMKAITNNILTKKSQETKVANAFIRAQLDLELDKFDKTQKGLRQEIETLKLENSTERIKNTDLQDQLQQANEFLAIYKAKFTEVNEQNAQTEEASQLLADTAVRYEQLYRQERAKNEALLTQKQTLTSKLAQLTEELTKKGHEQQDSKTKETNNEGELRKTKTELQQAKAELEKMHSKLKSTISEQSEKGKISGSGIRSESDYYINLEENLQQQRENNRQLEAEVQTLRLRLDRSVVQSQRVSSLEDALNVKSDQLNDLRRKTITLEKQVGVLEAEGKEEKSEREALRKENSALKTKLLESGQEVRKSYEIRDLESKKTAQKLTEDIATLTSELRDERRAAARLQVELQTHKAEVQRLEEFIEQGKRKEHAIFEELSQLRTTYESACEEGERLKSELRFQKGVQEGLNNEVASAQERIYKLNQENSEIRLKMQSLDNDISELRRELSGLKIYLNEVQEYANAKIPSPNWQEQRDRDNLNNFVQRVKKILRTSELSNASENRFVFAPAPTPALPDFLRNYDSNYSMPYEPPKLETLNDSPFTRNYGGEATYKYGDYN